MDKKFKIFVIIALTVLTFVVTAGIFLVLTTRPTTETVATEEPQKEIQEKDLELIYLEDPINANLSLGEDKIPHIIRLAVGIEIHKKEKDYKDFQANFEAKQVMIRNEIIEILRSKTYEEMMETSAQEVLSTEMRARLNELLGTEIIQNVYFGEFFIQ